MRRLVLTFYILAASAILAGCAGEHEYTVGRRLFELEQYESAIQTVQKALDKAPSNQRYRELLARIKEAAARDEYNRGLLFYGRNQLHLALEAFEKATRYDPEFEEAARAYLSVKEQRDVVNRVVNEIPALIADNKPDEALDRIAEIEAYSTDFPKIRSLKKQALEDSTVFHARRGLLALNGGDFEQAHKEFQIALNRTPGYSPAVDGLSRALAQIKAADLVAEGRRLLGQGRFAQAHARFEQALRIVPGHAGALQARTEAARGWARGLYEEGRALEEKGDFENLAEALRKYERAGALTEIIPEAPERIEALKKALAGEFRRRGQQYEELGEDYIGLALINFQMSLHCDPAQVELSRNVVSLKETFDNKRAFYIDMRAEADSSVGASFSKQLTQTLKKAVISSGIKDLYVVAPYDPAGGAPGLARYEGMAGRHLTIFTSLLSDDVVIRGENKPEVVRSHYKVGTRYVPNPDYSSGRRTLAEAEDRENDVRQEFDRIRTLLDSAVDADERALLREELEFERLRLEDAQDDVIKAKTSLASLEETVEQEVFQPYDYLVYTVTMEAKVEVSLEVADPYKGATRTLEVITGAATAEDSYNEEVQATDARGAARDPKELPTQSELLEKARTDAADKAVAWLKDTLTELSMQYHNRAKELEQIGNMEGAAEYFYAFYLTTPDKTTDQAREAIAYVRSQTHLITPDERQPPPAP